MLKLKGQKGDYLVCKSHTLTSIYFVIQTYLVRRSHQMKRMRKMSTSSTARRTSLDSSPTSIWRVSPQRARKD